ncbi:zinc-binding alcohol dehydrogenase [Albimonas sp. CAU 1670]|uniref:zinc-dependent alcohol dehydrogenase n=1 Tax=Albimonas sp. CAU 1670 TaxID=3032599 RepID=UPI0023D9A9AA|nr:zinc-binding alcohol dehydrogenase [Albimonas sp. CAU 1670]MDF2232028.1 zinc-binding alcohol dehydrogenase [Albimonas sp. CAU 1670]
MKLNSDHEAATNSTAPALVYTAPGRAEIRPAPLGEGEALLRMEVSALSRGTERLVFEGRVPETEHARMRAPFQEGAFPFPVKYGYCAVATVEDGPPDWIGRKVFALHPHQARFRLPLSALSPLPAGLPPARAALAANMETALNIVWDAGVGPGDRVAVIGAGVVGCLAARLCARLPGAEVILCDRIPSRQAAAEALGVKFASSPGEARAPFRDADGGACDVAIHTSASAAGLAWALDLLGDEGRVVEASWHGAGDVPAPLGGAFHSRRLSIVSSQVGRLPPARAPRWDHARRMATALRLLAEDPAVDALLSVEVPFEDLPQRLPELLAPGAEGVATLIRYP